MLLINLFELILFQSTIGTLLILILLLFRPITQRFFNPNWQYYMWISVFFFMLLPPLTIGYSKTPVTQTLPEPAPITAITNDITKYAPHVETKVIQSLPIEYTNVPLGKGIDISLHTLIVYLWLIITCALLLKNILQYILFIHTLRKDSSILNCPLLNTIKLEKRISRNLAIRIAPTIYSPMIVGIFFPTLYLPDKELSTQALRHILLHELTHYKRHDLWYKWFSMIVASIHWFNPSIYWATKQMSEACEISCDYDVTQKMGLEDCKNYMRTIVYLRTEHTTFQTMVFPMSNSKKQLIRRFEMIKCKRSFHKYSYIASILTAAFILGLTFFTGNVIASNLQDTLEVWTQNEIYNRDGATFSVNVTNKNLPTWIYEDIAGSDGNINVTVRRVQTRDMAGEVDEHAILELKGTKGTTILSNIIASGLNTISKNSYALINIPITQADYYESSFSFSEFNNEGFTNYRNLPIASLVSDLSGKRKYVKLNFLFNEDETLSSIHLNFWISDEYDNVSLQEQIKYDSVQADSKTIQFIDNFEKDYFLWSQNLTLPSYFAFYEENYLNKKVEGINMKIASYNTQEITLQSLVSLWQIKAYLVNIYDSNEDLIATQSAKKIPRGTITLKPLQFTQFLNLGTKIETSSQQYISGERYRIDIILFDEDDRVIYRQREYVNMP